MLGPGQRAGAPVTSQYFSSVDADVGPPLPLPLTDRRQGRQGAVGLYRRATFRLRRTGPLPLSLALFFFGLPPRRRSLSPLCLSVGPRRPVPGALSPAQGEPYTSSAPEPQSSRGDVEEDPHTPGSPS